MSVFSREPPNREPRGNGRLRDLAQRPEAVWAGLAVLLLAVIFTGWLVYGAMQAKSSLE